MGVFSRFSDIVNSNINSMLDRAEDPEKIVRLIIQEMEDTLVEVRASAARALADKKEIDRKLADFKAREAEWTEKAEFAVSKGRDDLAKGALAAKRKAAEMAEILHKERAAVEESIDKANADLAQLQAKLKEAKAKRKSLEVRRQNARDRVRVNRHVYDGRIDEALSRYDAVERKIDEIEAEAESYVLGAEKSLDEMFADLEAEDGLDAELKDLKQRVADKNNA
ncbi:MAG: phage shock protein PspA [Pseudomonadota bacterium]